MDEQLRPELLPAWEVDDVGRRLRHPRVFGVAGNPHDLYEGPIHAKPESPADCAAASPVARRGAFVDDGDERSIGSIGPPKLAPADDRRCHRLEIAFVDVRGNQVDPIGTRRQLKAFRDDRCTAARETHWDS